MFIIFVTVFPLFHFKSRWIFTQRLPSVAYLTSLDQYSIGSLLLLVFYNCWHAFISTNVISDEKNRRREMDSYVLIVLSIFYLLFNIFFLTWFVKQYKNNKNFKKEFEEQDKLRSNVLNNIVLKLEIKDLMYY